MQMREKVGKSRNTVFFQWFVAPEGRKVGSPKRRVRSQLARWEMKNCTPLWREAHFQVKRYKTPGSRSTFGSWDVEKVHAVVARSTFRSQNVQNTPLPDHFWNLRCRKSARRCGARHFSKWKGTKHTIVRPLLEVAMSKKCTPLWREAHFQVKMYKTPQCQTTFGSWDVEKVHAVVARSTFRSQNVQNTPCMDHFWKLRCLKSARRCGAKHISKSKCTKHTMYGPFLEVQMSFRVVGARDFGPCQKSEKREGFVAFSTTTTTTHTTLQYITLHYNYNYTFTTFYYTTLHYTTLHSITLNYTTLHYTTLHYTTLHYTTLHYTTLHYITLQLQLHTAFPETMAGVGHLKRIFKDAFRVAGAVQRHVPQRCSEVRALISWRGCVLEYQIFRFAEMILRDRCSTSYDLASIFRGRRSTLHRWSGKIAKRIGTRLPALH